MSVVLVALGAPACGLSGYDSQPGGAELQVAVEALYPDNARWGDYVHWSDRAADWYGQQDLACARTETGPAGRFSCIHGGEKLQVRLPQRSSCAGLRIEDQLGAFDWVCDSSGGEVVFFTRALREDRGLADLVDATGFLANRVRIVEGDDVTAESPSRPWHDNPVLTLPANDGTGVATLDVEGAVYVAAQTAFSDGYNIDADRISVVTLGNAELKKTVDTTPNCSGDTGETDSPEHSTLLCAGNQSFLWLEGRLRTHLDAADQQYAVFWKYVNLSTMRRLFAFDGPDHTENNLLFLYDSPDNWLRFIHLGNSSWRSIALYRADRSLVHGLRTDNVRRTMTIIDSEDVVVHDAFFAHSSRAVWIYGSNIRATLSHLTVVDGEAIGIDDTGSEAHSNTVNQLLHVGRGGTDPSFVLERTRDNLLSQIAVRAAGPLVELDASENDAFVNSLVVAGTPSCIATGATTPLVTDGSCQLSGASTATLTQKDPSMVSFVGLVADDDPVQRDDSMGTADPSQVGDWAHFANPYRAWSEGDSPLFEPLGRGHCTPEGSGGPTLCQITDWRLESDDQAFGRRSGDGSVVNQPFEPALPCPQAVHGDRALTDTSGRTFLVNAQEAIRDGIGDENGLCESGEVCIYSPHFGAYQGEGNWRRTEPCAFADGTVMGVTMHAYPSEWAQ